MQNVIHERLNRGSAISIVPCNDVVHRIGVRLSSFWAHVLILLLQSRKNFPCHEKGARPRAGKSVWHQVRNLPM